MGCFYMFYRICRTVLPHGTLAKSLQQETLSFDIKVKSNQKTGPPIPQFT